MGCFSSFEKDDEPLSSVGLMFSRPEHYQVMNCAVKTAGPIDVQALKDELANSAFTTLPRFTSLLIRHPWTGREHWRKTRLVIDDHIKVVDEDICDVNDFLAELAVSCPLPVDKPLWEVHVLAAQNCTVFRVHHALADGMSFMSLLQSFFSGKPNISLSLAAATNGNKPVVISKKKSIRELIEMAWFMLIFAVEFILKCSCVKDKKTVVTGGDGVQLWPRKLVTASFTLEDMNIVKKSVVPNATINDVMLGVLSSGISDYINLHTSNGTRKDQKITALILVNLRPFTGIPDLMKADPKSGWGNKISFILHPMSLHKLKESDPLHQLKEAKLSMDKKKLSKVARFSYILGKLTMTVFGPRFATLMLSRMMCNTTLAFSNIVGPSQEVTMVGKPVISIKMSLSSLPHAITMHMLSYAGKAEMQISVAKDIIHDPDVLAKCIEDALQRMKKAAISTSEAYEKLPL